MDYEDFLVKVGGFGRYQHILYIALFIGYLPGALMNLSIVFMAAVPDHVCVDPAIHSSQEYGALSNINFSIAINNGSSLYSQEAKFRECHISIKNLSNVYDYYNENETQPSAFDNSSKTYGCSKWAYSTDTFSSTIATKWNLVCDKKWFVTIPKSAYMTGYLIGALASGFLSDRFGRRVVLIGASLLQVLAAAVSAFSPNFTFFVVLRFLIALGRISAATTLFVLCMEFFEKKYRSMLAINIFNSWALSYVALAGIAYFVRDWWKLQLVCTVPAAICFFYSFFIPESPRWLLTKGEKEKAKKITNTIIRVNKAKLLESIELSVKLLYAIMAYTATGARNSRRLKSGLCNEIIGPP